MHILIRQMLVVFGLAMLPTAAAAHPDATSHAGALSYLVAMAITIVAVAIMILRAR